MGSEIGCFFGRLGASWWVVFFGKTGGWCLWVGELGGVFVWRLMLICAWFRGVNRHKLCIHEKLDVGTASQNACLGVGPANSAKTIRTGLGELCWTDAQEKPFGSRCRATVWDLASGIKGAPGRRDFASLNVWGPGGAGLRRCPFLPKCYLPAMR